MLKVDILRACIDHVDDIAVIENLSFAIPWSRKSILEEITVNKFAMYYCAIIDGRLAGYAGMWHICDEGHITNVAVHPDFRNCGVGSALLQKLLEFASGEGIVSMTLEVRRNNLTAQGLYRKFGFADAGYRRAYYADNGEDALIMWKHSV